MKVKIDESIEEIELINSDGQVVARWFRATGTWDSFTERVKQDGHYGRFLVFEEAELESSPKHRNKSEGKDVN